MNHASCLCEINPKHFLATSHKRETPPMPTHTVNDHAEYSLYLSKRETEKRHHLYSLDWFPAVRRRAEYVLKEMRRGGGTLYRLHHDWFNSVEVWETYMGDHEAFTTPDRLVAHAYWTGTSKLTVVDDVEKAKSR